jgi:hypothetical protein
LATKIQNQVPLNRQYTGTNPKESFRLLSDVGIHVVETVVHAFLRFSVTSWVMAKIFDCISAMIRALSSRMREASAVIWA